jgi:hypothetical protein
VIVTWELYAGESTFSGAATYGGVRLTVLTDGWTANVTLSGPATKWFAVGLDATMHTTAGRRPYAHICAGTRRCHICTGTLLIADSTALGIVSTPATSALGLGSPLPHRDWAPPLRHRHRDWTHPCHIGTGTGPTPATPALAAARRLSRTQIATVCHMPLVAAAAAARVSR